MRQFEGMDSERHGVKLKLSIRLIIPANVAEFEGNDWWDLIRKGSILVLIEFEVFFVDLDIHFLPINNITIGLLSKKIQ